MEQAKILGFTGHRPNKIGGYKIPNQTYINITEKMKAVIDEQKPDYIISGMAQGVDQWAAQIAIDKNIPFIAAIPFDGFNNKWPDAALRYHEYLKSKSYSAFVISGPGYDPKKMQIRNEWIVDKSSLLVAVWDGTSGGTANCVRYAKKVNKQIIFIEVK